MENKNITTFFLEESLSCYICELFYNRLYANTVNDFSNQNDYVTTRYIDAVGVYCDDVLKMDLLSSVKSFCDQFNIYCHKYNLPSMNIMKICKCYLKLILPRKPFKYIKERKYIQLFGSLLQNIIINFFRNEIQMNIKTVNNIVMSDLRNSPQKNNIIFDLKSKISICIKKCFKNLAEEYSDNAQSKYNSIPEVKNLNSLNLSNKVEREKNLKLMKDNELLKKNISEFKEYIEKLYKENGQLKKKIHRLKYELNSKLSSEPIVTMKSDQESEKSKIIKINKSESESNKSENESNKSESESNKSENESNKSENESNKSESESNKSEYEKYKDDLDKIF